MSGTTKAALLLVDFMNPLDFEGARRVARSAIKAAKATIALKRRCRAEGVPSIYANDNFGHWDSQFSEVVQACERTNPDAAKLVSIAAPEQGDLSVLKPRHSAFYGTPLEFLLGELRVDTLIVTGIATDSCVLFTALDAFLRKYRVWVPVDCVASETPAARDRALEQMRRAAKVWTGASRTALDIAFKRCAALHR